jgi:uncharacterized protein (DUF58 family)
MLPPDLYKKIQRFHFTSKRLASDLFAGSYVSAFKGRGMEFAEVREYEFGDEIRSIDWNVSARFGRPFVKVFHEERELTVMLLLDLSGSHRFGTRVKFKRELMAEAAGMLAFLAIRTNDKVGALLFGSQTEKFIPPRKGAGHVWRLIKEIFTFEPASLTTDIASALTYLNRVVRRHAIVFLLSDCLDSGFERALRLTARKHDLNVLVLSDPAEAELPAVGLMTVRDPETGQAAVVNTSGRRFRERWRALNEERLGRLVELFHRAGVVHELFTTVRPVDESLIRLFEKRARR